MLRQASLRRGVLKVLLEQPPDIRQAEGGVGTEERKPNDVAKVGVEGGVLRERTSVDEPVLVLLHDLVVLGEADSPGHDYSPERVEILFPGAGPPLVAFNHELVARQVVVHVSIADFSCIKVVGYEERPIRIVGLEDHLRAEVAMYQSNVVHVLHRVKYLQNLCSDVVISSEHLDYFLKRHVSFSSHVPEGAL
jgi:hypothetical protein